MARLIIGALRHFNGERYYLYQYTVMPDHVHCIIRPVVREGRCESLGRILHSIKGWTANEVNKVLGRKGPLWQRRYHNRILRSASDCDEKADYIWRNPVKFGLVNKPGDWPWFGRGDAWEGRGADGGQGCAPYPNGEGEAATNGNAGQGDDSDAHRHPPPLQHG